MIILFVKHIQRYNLEFIISIVEKNYHEINCLSYVFNNRINLYNEI